MISKRFLGVCRQTVDRHTSRDGMGVVVTLHLFIVIFVMCNYVTMVSNYKKMAEKTYFCCFTRKRVEIFLIRGNYGLSTYVYIYGEQNIV